jgi:regulator of chromosome condensation
LGFRPKVVHSEVEEEEYKGESAEERSKRLNKDVLFQRSPVLISELKRIVKIECGTNHALALDDKGHVFVWGAGEQNQLARRVVARTAEGALVPREFGLQRKKITKIGSGDYNSFAVDKDGKVYAWGLNTFSQTGIPTSENTNDTILVPTLVKNLSAYSIKEIDGGAHHTISCTESGQVLVWGRIDNHQGGMEIDKFAESDVYTDEHQRRRYLKKPVTLSSKLTDSISWPSLTSNSNW